eukprot:CAMPEP_0117021034 /NCGR_PEP_ID=MMETSP0472-20121206/15915_1 /TAXON_ID=693140 ORGANISM="Tiarina fusus, Strain LIS" /NCGR_SAMPLE_ID=MMETSP0472 /ASSEMBLY_ACC=CAM_ASM_000603 /LENGTH=182 /DNA_ID=CAMNT_0004726401 /DNA_START=161 /DNA_END=706 /DNA_ORIENTATION=+
MGGSQENVVDDDDAVDVDADHVETPQLRTDCDDEEESRNLNSSENHCDFPALEGTGDITGEELQAANDALERENRAAKEAFVVELRGRTLLETLLKVIAVVKTPIEADTSTEDEVTTRKKQLRAVSLTPYFPSEIREKFEDTVRLVSATQKSTRANDREETRDGVDPPQKLSFDEISAQLND